MNAAPLIAQVRSCTLCKANLPLQPRPIVQFSATSRLLIIGQAPGRISHHSGIAFDDKAGDRLAGWLGISGATLHDPARVAIVSMGLCYPGKARGGDKPPRPECAPTWHDRIFAEIPDDRVTVLVGAYAQSAYLPDWRRLSMRERILRWRETAPAVWPLPHPSWRSTLFMRDHPWFEDELLPRLRLAVTDAVGRDDQAACSASNPRTSSMPPSA